MLLSASPKREIVKRGRSNEPSKRLESKSTVAFSSCRENSRVGLLLFGYSYTMYCIEYYPCGGADPRCVPVRAFMGDPGKCGKAVRPALSGTAPRSRQDKHLTDLLRIGIGSICKKEVSAMACDETLYRQYLSGDDAGLEALMKKYGDPLTLYIDGYLHDVHESEELMLDVFAYLFTKKPRIRDGGLKAYLYKAARHMALRHKSRRKPLFSLDALTDEPEGRLLAEEVIQTEERNRVLHFCMGEMNPDYREVLYLTYFEDMSYAQAAEVTGKTVKQITNMVYRGKESLRRLLEREGITNAES